MAVTSHYHARSTKPSSVFRKIPANKALTAMLANVVFVVL